MILLPRCLSFTVDITKVSQRLDKFLVLSEPSLTREQVQDFIEKGYVTRDGIPITKPSLKVKVDEVYSIEIPPPEDSHILPQSIAFDIIYEDKDLIVINKPAGLVVHPAPGHRDKTLVNGLLEHCGEELSGIGGVKRPGIVHRLDKDTSGLMVVAKNDHAHHILSSQFQDRSLSRNYLAIVWGDIKPTTGTVNEPIGRNTHNRQKMAINYKNGKEAITHYEVLHRYVAPHSPSHIISYVKCRLSTGRTHQIRVHMAHLGHSLIGDPTYGKNPKDGRRLWGDSVCLFPRQALHAHTLQFFHPVTKELMQFSQDLPEDMKHLLTLLEGHI